MEFLEYIGTHYDEIHDLLSRYKDFDEDVMHNTIVACHQAISSRNIDFNSDMEMLRYFISSYRTNQIRKHKYYHSKNVSPLGDKYVVPEDSSQMESSIDLQIVLDAVKQRFGDELYDAYYRYITEDISIAKLQKETSIKNLKQKIKNIKDYIKTIK